MAYKSEDYGNMWSILLNKQVFQFFLACYLPIFNYVFKFKSVLLKYRLEYVILIKL